MPPLMFVFGSLVDPLLGIASEHLFSSMLSVPRIIDDVRAVT